MRKRSYLFFGAVGTLIASHIPTTDHMELEHIVADVADVAEAQEDSPLEYVRLDSNDFEEIRLVQLDLRHTLPSVTEKDARMRIQYSKFSDLAPVRIPDKHYDYYASIPRTTHHAHSTLQYLTPFDPTIQDIAQRLRGETNSDGSYKKTDEQFLNDTLDFVHGTVMYDVTFDDVYPKGEYKKFPLQTLHDGEGDCDDSMLLYTSIVMAGGMKVGVLHLLPEDDYAGHYATLVRGDYTNNISNRYSFEIEGFTYTYAEPTSKKIGRATEKIGERRDTRMHRMRAYMPEVSHSEL